jgi:CspA family cold shock protein
MVILLSLVSLIGGNILEENIVIKKGSVKFFNFAKGYGFIQSSGEDYFVHVTDIQNGDLLLDGEDVTFKAVQGHKGSQAIEVERVLPPDMTEEDGVVKHFNVDRGFGFIGRDGKADVFAHFTDVIEDHRDIGLKDGDCVKFFVRKDRDGRDRAYKIRIV